MPVNMTPANVILEDLGLGKQSDVHKFFTQTCAIHMDKYLPYREGTLAETVVIGGHTTDNVTTDTITYQTPYATYVYYGLSKNGKSLHYNTDKHNLATSYWDKHMWTAEKERVIDEVQEYIRRRK